MSRNFTLTLLLGISFIIASPALFAQTFTPPVINNLDGEAQTYLPKDVSTRLDSGDDALVVKGSLDLWRSNLTVRITQGLVAAEDRLRVQPVNLPDGALTVSGEFIYYKGNLIGEAKNYDADPQLIIQFSSFADAEAISATIRSLVYFNANPGSQTIQPRKISVVLNDGFGNKSTPAIVTLNVSAGNRAPYGVDKYYVLPPQLPFFATIASGLLSSETDPEGGALNLAITQSPLHGSFIPAPNGQFTYTPFPGFIGLDSITYNVCDPSGSCTQLKAIFNMGAGNTPPVTAPDAYVIGKNQVLFVDRSRSVLVNDSDPNSGSARIFNTATVAIAPTNGTLQLDASGSFRYVPNTGFSGTDQFTYNNCDRNGLCTQGIVKINIGNNTPPIAVHDRYVFPGEIVTGNILANDVDREGNNLISSLVTAPVKGTVVLNADGSFTYTTNSGYFGADSLIYQVCDNGTPSLCDTATLLLYRVTRFPPVITAPGTQTTSINTLLTFNNNISVADPSAGPAEKLKMTLAADHGTLTIPVKTGLTFTRGTGTAEATFTFNGTLTDLNNALKIVEYTPTNNFNDIDTLRLEVNDQFGPLPLIDSAKVPIIVGPQEPVVTGVTSSASNGLHPIGDTISVHVNFNRPVVVTGNPRILMETGTTDRYATFRGGSGTLLYFRYDVQAGDETPDLDYVATTSLELNGGTLKNISGTHNAILTLPAPGSPASVAGSKDIVIDGVAPTITSIDWPADSLYKTGDVLSFTLHISEAVTATSSTLPVTIGAVNVQAALTASTAQTLTYTYTIQSGELDADGIGAAFPTGTITDGAQNALVNSTPGLRAGVLVDAVAPTIVSIDWPADNLYKADDVLNFTLHFSEPVTATTSTLPVKIGATTVQATPTAITAQTLTYSYTIQNNELDADGIEADFPTGTITDIAGNTLAISTPGLRAGVLVDAVPPVVTAGQVFTVAENAASGAVVGTIAATDAGAVKPLQNWQGSTATFSLNAATGQLTLSGTLNAKTTPSYDISVTVSDGVNTSATGSVRINVTDGTPPSIISMDYPADKIYKAGEELVFTAHTNEGVIATSSTLPVTIGITTVQATLKTATAREITYAYVVLNGQFDGDGIAAGIPTGTITDSTGNALQSFTPAPSPGVLVDAVPPVVTAGQIFTILENAAAGTAIGNVAATDAGAVKPLQNWQGSTANFSINVATGALTLTGALNYEANSSFDIPITVTDGVNTSAAVTVKINVVDVNEAPSIGVIPNVTPCAGGAETQLQVTGITPGPETAQMVTLSISADRDIFSTLNIDNAGIIRYALKADATGTATVTVTVKDNGGTANNGTDTYSRSFTASVGTGPTLSISSNKGSRISKGETAILTASGASSYEWSTGELTASISVRPLQKTTYQVKGTAANGCMAEGSFELDINEDFKLDATNIVTPNGDGINDRWVIRNIDAYPNNEVKIFDRSGRLIYEKKGYLNEWGGTANGKPLQDGTYYYILDFGPGLPKFKGYITVIRDNK